MKTKRVVFDFENADYDKMASCILEHLSSDYTGGKYANCSAYCYGKDVIDFGGFTLGLDITFVAPIVSYKTVLGRCTDIVVKIADAMLVTIESCSIEDKGDVEYEFAYDNIESFLSVELRKAFKRIARKAKKQAA